MSANFLLMSNSSFVYIMVVGWLLKIDTVDKILNMLKSCLESDIDFGSLENHVIDLAPNAEG